MSSPATSSYDSNIDTLFKRGREKLFPKNQIVSYQGDPLTSIHLVKKGFLKAYTILDTGDTRTMFLLGPGDIFPIAFSLTMDWQQFQIRYFYQSLTDSVLEILDQSEFRRMVETDPKMTATYMSYMSASNQAIMNQLEAMKHKTAKDKILLLLPYLVDKIGKRTRPHTYKLEIKLSHQEIADLSGITRETTTALLKELEEDGVIQQQRDTWIIKLNDDQETRIG
ncbi:MAG TPA: Crp/Fnr family transcriptional regulator [Candidatus Saccharimonadales bacterium]|nr:Crp/Fnr family transcriptional regulator [Candidatus Saccharimonadales bacterium]